MNDSDEERRLLELRAAEVRRRLEDRLDRLNERRHRMVATARAAVHPPTTVILVAAVGLAAVLLVARRVRARRREQTALTRLGRLLEPARAEKGFVVRGLERAGTSLVALGAQHLARQGLDSWLEAEAAKRRPSGFRLT
ncbi:MAG: hypothetical protein RL685_7633 [Pseudomonadota bacterium]|jgi:hypothetical protein